MTDGLEKENQVEATMEMKHNDTHSVADTSATKIEHLGDVKVEDKPLASTTNACTSPPIK